MVTTTGDSSPQAVVAQPVAVRAHMLQASPVAPKLLMRNRWFASLRPALRERLWTESKPLAARKGQSLWVPGQAVSGHEDGFFLLLDGQLRVSAVGPTGDEAIVTFVRPFQWFGEMALVERLPRMHAITCAEDCELRVLARDDFDACMRDLEFACAVATLVVSRTRFLVNLLADARLHSAKARIARRLLLLSQDDDVQSEQPRDAVEVSHDTLASMLGLSRQSIATSMTALRDCGAVSQSYGRIVIESPAALAAEAQAV